MVNISKPLINVVNLNKPKVLTVPKRSHRLEPKGNVVGTEAESSSVMGIQHHRWKERAYVLHQVNQAEHGKPVRFPAGRVVLACG